MKPYTRNFYVRFGVGVTGELTPTNLLRMLSIDSSGDIVLIHENDKVYKGQLYTYTDDMVFNRCFDIGFLMPGDYHDSLVDNFLDDFEDIRKVVCYWLHHKVKEHNLGVAAIEVLLDIP